MKTITDFLESSNSSNIYLGSDYLHGYEDKIRDLIDEGYISFIVMEDWDNKWEDELDGCADYINIDGPIGVLASKTIDGSVAAYKWYISSASVSDIKHDKQPYIICQSEF